MDQIMAELDPTNTNVTFETFTKFMVKRTKDNDTQDEILESFRSIANDKVRCYSVNVKLSRNLSLRKI